MTIPPLGLDSYQTKAIRTDRTRKSGAELDLTVLGLVGEAGSLLSEVKKKQRDSRSYLGYEDAVTEEMGDMLWYLAAVAHHHELKLSEIAASCGAPHATLAELQPQHDLPLAFPSVAFERTLLRLSGAVGRLADFCAGASPQHRETLLALLSEIFDNMVRAVNRRRTLPPDRRPKLTPPLCGARTVALAPAELVGLRSRGDRGSG